MITMRVEVERSGRLPGHEDVRRLRDDFVAELMRSVLGRVATLQPVETGRTRRAWLALAEAVGQGSEAGSQLVVDGEVRVTSSQDQTQIDAVNRVEYVNFVEYGTSRQAPAGMVRKGLGLRD